MKNKIIMFLFLISTFIFCEIYYVDNKNPKASDSNPGTKEQPFLTISKGISILQPGDTLIIKEGIYREELRINKKGQDTKPILIKAEENERVIITGSEKISGWRKCKKEEVFGNENFQNIYVCETKFLPEILTDGEKILNLARIPEQGWWRPTKAEGNNVFYDEINLNQKDKDAWKGWTLCALYGAGGGITKHTEFEFYPEEKKIVLKNNWSFYSPKIDVNRDKYYFSNHPLAIKKEGDYAYIKTETGYKIFLWPTKFDDKGEVIAEVVNKGNLINPHQSENLILDGLEICFSNYRGIGSSPCIVKNFTIKNCYFHDCNGYGIGITGGENIEIRNSIFRGNSYGIVIGGAKNIKIEKNDIGWNKIDGVVCARSVRNLKISKNYIHHHFMFGHPDNIQFWEDVDGIEISDNVLIISVQTLMSSDVSNIKLINNIVIGSGAASLIIGGQKSGLVYGRKRVTEEDKKKWEEWESLPPDNVEINHNTILATGYGPFNITAKGVKIYNNIIWPMHEYPIVYGITHRPTFSADYNLFWIGTRTSQVLSNLRNDKLELNSFGEIPQFVNAPTLFSIGWSENSKEKIFLRESLNGWNTGDFIEINMDGVMRKIKEVGQNYIVIEPALDKIPEFELFVFNWKNNSKCIWDLKLKEGSSGYKKSEDGKDIGSDLNIQNYKKGDFDGDGKIDLPAKFGN
ncbi:MAG: right-handed parallel beta-helix repeat-containing protein [Candidatus Omnitrophica bacterium]|nr:right-handed parallel beta-helix repeat-containing protein [Candidatus Omnitrophota bacterium]